MDNKLISQDFNINRILSQANKLSDGKGFVFCINGETGFGKSAFLQQVKEMLEEKNIKAIYVDSQAPIGKFNVGNLTPMYPFIKIVEFLKENKNLSPEKRFYINLGMTALASIPLAGDVFYFVKESSKDYKQLRKEQSRSANQTKVSHVTSEFSDTLKAFAEKEPYVLLLDDVHWVDAQSVELLSYITSEIADLPIMIVLAFKQSPLEQKGLPFYSYLKNHLKSPSIEHFQLKQFNKQDIYKAIKSVFPSYITNELFENWLMEYSFGIPGIIFEYLRYYKQNGLIDQAGKVTIDFEKSEYLPTTLNKLFSEELAEMTEDEKNILAICSAEGQEFSISVVSQLLNQDVLQTIRKLRAIQNKTGLIRSLGVQRKYGMKTTAYKFTQTFYYEFFQKMLEFEENAALHGQVAGYLQKAFETAENDEVKEEIAPYLAGHSIEAGDQSTAESMFLYTQEISKKYGTYEIIRHTADSLQQSDNETGMDYIADNEFYNELKGTISDVINLENIDSGNQLQSSSGMSDETENGENLLHFVDFKLFRKSIMNDFINGHYNLLLDKIYVYESEHLDDDNYNEYIQIQLLKSRALIEQNNFEDAIICLNNALEITKEKNDITNECIVYNSFALYYSETGENQKALQYLDLASELSLRLPSEMKLITMANIAGIYKDISPAKAKQYLEAAMKISSSLEYDSINNILKKMF